MDASKMKVSSTANRIRPALLACALASLLPLTAAARDGLQQLPAPGVPATAGDTPGQGCGGGCASGTGGQDPQQLPVPPQMEAGFELRRVVFKGATVFDDAGLQSVVAGYIGRNVGFSDLQALAQKVTRHYHANGYILAQAVLPVQEVVDGQVEISIIEGMLGSVSLELDPDTPVSEARVTAMLTALQPGAPLDGQSYERSMLLLSDLPGVRAQSVLETGRQAGSNDLVVEVSPGDRLRFNLDLDNHGTRETGRWRLGGTVRWASPLGIGDNLDLRLLASDDHLFDGDGTLFGRIAYELPLNAAGTRIGMGSSRVSYNLGDQFAVLDAHGIARIHDLGVMHPVIRQRGQNLFLRFFTDQKDLTDEMRAVDLETGMRVRGVGVSWAWERRDGFGGGGYWSSGGALYHGHLDLNDPGSRELDRSEYGYGTAGDFTKLTLQVARLQRLADRLSLFAALGAQFSDGNLHSSEKLSLGGPRAVRAYPSSEALVDKGAIANVELRWAMSASFTGFVFYDIASGDFHRRPNMFVFDNDRTLRGGGLGMNYSSRNGFSAQATLAWRSTRKVVSDGGDRDPRLFIHMMKSF